MGFYFFSKMSLFSNLSLHLFIWLGCSIVPTYAQTQPVFESIGMEEGLSYSQVLDISQDIYGFLWIATSKGLNRYDGYNFKIFLHDPFNPESLYSNRIQQIFPDSKGNIWIGFDYRGLGRYDQQKDQFFNYPVVKNDTSGMTSDIINQIHEDGFGTIWVGTSEGLLQYNCAHDNFKKVYSPTRGDGCISKQNVNVIFEDSKGNVWVGTNNGLFVRKENQPAGFFRIGNEGKNEISNEQISAIDEDMNGDLWIGTGRGLNRLCINPLFHKDTQRGIDISQFLLKNVPERYAKRRVITALETDDHGNLWVGSNLGIIRISVDKPSSQTNYLYRSPYLNQFKENKISILQKDTKGNLWFCSENPELKLGMYDSENEDFIISDDKINSPNSAPKSGVSKIFEDKSGNLWIGFLRGRLYKIDLYSDNFRFINKGDRSGKSINSNDVYALFYEDQNDFLWAGTLQGLNRIDTKNGSILTYEQSLNSNKTISGRIVGAITPDPEGFLWIGYFDHKISKYFPDTDSFFHYNDHSEDQSIGNTFNGWSVRDIIVDADSTVWFGAWDGGLYKYDRKSSTFSNITIRTPNIAVSKEIKVNVLLEFKPGWLLIGTSGEGLFLYDIANDSSQNLRHNSLDKNSILSDYIHDVYKDESDQIWIAHAHGIERFDPDRNYFYKQTKEGGVISNFAFSIISDKNDALWISTGDGIKRYEPSAKNYENFPIENDWHVNEYNYRAAARGKNNIYFGGYSGIVYFNPDKISRNPIAPQTDLVSLRIRNQEISAGEIHNGQKVLKKSIFATDTLVLSSRNNDFSIEFSSFHFSSTASNKYAYRLDDFDAGWKYTDASHRLATYTNLPPGEYNFRVIAGNKDNIWNTKGRGLTIIVEPAWYQTSFFKIFLLLIAVSTVVFLMRLRTQRLRFREKQLKTLVEERTAELKEADRLKTRFFTNLSHEIRTPLTLILAPLDDIIEGQDISKTILNNLQIIQKNGYRLLRMVNQLLDYRKAESGAVKPVNRPGEMKSFLSGIISLFMPLAHNKAVVLNLDILFDSLKIAFDHDILEKILYNLLSNSLKNTEKGDEITLGAEVKYLQKDRVQLTLRVEDSGNGIQESKIHSIFNSFYQAGNNTNSNQKGTGIGLAYARELTEVLNGTINVKSSIGKGTVFTLIFEFGILHEGEQEISEFNYSLANLEIEKAASQKNPLVPEIISDEKKATLLVVEDNADMLHFVSSSLSGYYNVLSATDGIMGLKVANEKIPDIIISDVMMPEMNGFELCEKLKTNTETCHIPVVLLTSKGSDKSRMAGLKRGAEAYIPKPFKMKILIAQLESLLQARANLQQRLKDKGWMIEHLDRETTDLDQKFLRELMEVIQNNLSEPELNADFLAREMAISKTQLYRKIKGITGMSVHLFIRDIKLNRAMELIKQKKVRISDVAYSMGFNSISYFTRCFSEKFGNSPTDYLPTEVK